MVSARINFPHCYITLKVNPSFETILVWLLVPVSRVVPRFNDLILICVVIDLI